MPKNVVRPAMMSNLAESYFDPSKKPTIQPLNNLIYEQELYALKQNPLTAYDQVISASSAILNAQQALITFHTGNLNLQPQATPIDANTTFNLASVSKFIVMQLVLHLENAGLLTLEQTIESFFPAENIPNLEKITITHLMSQYSGLKDTTFCSNYTQESPLAEILSSETHALPGQTFFHANVNYVLLSKIIEKAAHKSLQEVFEQYVKKPLKLSNTGLITHHLTNHTHGYQFDKQKEKLEDTTYLTIWGASNFYSNPSDLAKIYWAFFISDNYLPSTYRQKVINSCTKENLGRSSCEGWAIEKYAYPNGDASKFYFGTQGWDGSHTVFVCFDPTQQQVYVTACSKTQGLNLYQETKPRKTIGLGCLAIDTLPDNDAAAIIQNAIANGVTVFDVADVYGKTFGSAETTLVRALQKSGAMPKVESGEIIVSTKIGLTLPAYDLNMDLDYLADAIQACITRLQLPSLPLVYIHRIEKKSDREFNAIATLMKKLCDNKIIKAVGLSEVSQQQLRQFHETCPVAAVQIEHSPWSLFEMSDEGIIPTARELNIQVYAYSPTGRGFFTEDKNLDYFQNLPQDSFLRYFKRYSMHKNRLLDNYAEKIKFQIAVKKIVGNDALLLEQIIFAWQMHLGIIPIVETKNTQHLNSNLKSLTLELEPNQVAAITEAAKSLKIRGKRYDNRQIARINHDKDWLSLHTHQIDNEDSDLELEPDKADILSQLQDIQKARSLKK